MQMKSAQIHAMFIDCVWRTKWLASSPRKSIHPVRMISINTGIECFQLAQELRLRNPTIQCQWTIPGLQYSEKENGIGFSRRSHCILRGNAGFLARDFLGSRRRTLEDIKLREKQNCVWVYESRFTCYFVRAWLLRRLCRFPCLWVI